MNSIKEFIGWGIAIIALVGACAYVGGFAYRAASYVPAQKNVGGGFALDQRFFISPGSGVQQKAGSSEATTSVVYMQTSDTASSTITGAAGLGTSFDLNMIAVASTTATKYLWTIAWSPDKIDWYCEDGSTLNSGVSQTHGAGCLVHDWTPATTDTVLKNVSQINVQSKYFRVTISAAGANGSLWAETVMKSDNPN